MNANGTGVTAEAERQITEAQKRDRAAAEDVKATDAAAAMAADPELAAALKPLVAAHGAAGVASRLQDLFKQQDADADAKARDEAAGKKDTSGVMFWRCTKTHQRPVLDENGEIMHDQMRGTQEPFLIQRVWQKGVIYPFRTYKQLPLQLEKAGTTTNEDGEIVQQYQPVFDEKTGKPIVLDFVPAVISDDQKQKFFNGDQNTGIENPVRGVDRPGNYVGVEGVGRSSAEQRLRELEALAGKSDEVILDAISA